MAIKTGKVTRYDPPQPFTKRMTAMQNYDDLPFFVSTSCLQRFTGRHPRTIMKWIDTGHLPSRTELAAKNKGWMKPEIVKWLKKHPEAMRQ